MNSSNLYIINLIKFYLEAYKIAFNDKELCKVLVTDPDFPSLASVSRTLNYYGLSSEAYLSDKQEGIPSLQGKLVHTSINGGHFFVVKEQDENSFTLFDGKKYNLVTNEFLKIWDRVVLFVEEPIIGKTSRRGQYSVQTWMALLSVLSSLLLLNKYCALSVYPILLLNCIGVGLSVLLMKHRMNICFADNYCNIGKKFDCRLVSAKQPLLGILPFSLDELGMFFFFWNILIVLMNGFVCELQLAILAMASLVCLGLLSYQSFFIHKYCLYCLGAYIVIWLSTLMSVKTVVEPMNWGNMMFNMGIAACSALLLSSVVSLYFQKQKKSFENEIQLLRLKRNHTVYRTLANGCSKVDDLGLSGMLFGDKRASSRIRMVVSLDCKFCRKAIREAASLIKRFPHRFNCEIVLTDVNGSTKDRVDDYVTNHLREFNIIKEYGKGNSNMSIFEKLRSKNFVEELELASIISQYRNNQERIKELSITKLPLVQINGITKSPYYDISDYQYMDEILMKR